MILTRWNKLRVAGKPLHGEVHSRGGESHDDRARGEDDYSRAIYKQG